MSDVLIAPFSNSDIRDWPVTNFAALVGLLLERLDLDVRIRIVGTANQKMRAREIVRDHPVDRVVSECGRLAWPEVVDQLKLARCIIGNNSGITHLGAYFGTPTVCIFGGSHQRNEWRALGSSVIMVSRVIGCSPCQLDHGGTSPYAKACLREIQPRIVADAAFLSMERGATRHPGERV